MFRRNLPPPDFLLTKQNEISQLSQQADEAVDLVTRTMNGLELINQQLDSAISEIDEYSKQLAEARATMTRQRNNNAAVISNFAKLLDAGPAESAGE